MCKGEGSVACLNSCHICAVKRILILERNENRFRKKSSLRLGYGLFFIGRGVGGGVKPTRVLKPNVNFVRKQGSQWGVWTQDHNPRWSWPAGVLRALPNLS